MLAFRHVEKDVLRVDCMEKKILDETYYDELLARSYYWPSEKAHKAFVDDFYNTKQELENVRSLMTQDMFQGRASDKNEKQIIKKYNKLVNHMIWLKQKLYMLSRLK